MKHNEFVVQIGTLVDEGVRLLDQDNNILLKKRIEHSLVPYFEISNDELSAEEFMIAVTLAMVSSLSDSHRLSRFEQIAQFFKPLAAIKDIVTTDDFNAVVAARPNSAIKDIRLPLEEFLGTLDKYLHRDRSAEAESVEQKSESRKIWGFTPRPDDRERDQQ